MAAKTYACKECGGKFEISYFLFKPKDIKCPKCKSSKVEEQKSASSCCGSGGFT